MKRWILLASVIYLLAFASVGRTQDADTIQVAGSYAGVYHIPDDPHHYDSKVPQPEKLINETWTFTQDGNKVTGTEKTDKGDRSFTGTIKGTRLLGAVLDGDMRYLISLTVDPSDGGMAGTIRVGAREFLLKLTKK